MGAQLTVDTPVLVVGRGPVGMTTALLLARWGVASTLVDPLPVETVTPGSKAVLISGHVIAATEPTGVGLRIAAEGLPWHTSRTFIRGREVATTRVEQTSGLFPKIVNLPQKRVEELLLEQVLAEPLVTLRSQTRVTGIVDAGDQVRVALETPAGVDELTAAWLVGADGSRSAVRKLLNIPFDGYGLDENFLIVDIAADLPFPAERQFHFDPVYNPGRTVLIHPQPGSTWHIDWQVGPEVDAAEELENGRLDKRLRAIVGEADYEVLWHTTYQFKQLRARDFRSGRCLLVGDAAHLTSPYGARGMNSGIADAENAAWRLGMVLCGLANDSLIDGYNSERVYASEENLAITGATARFMCPPTTLARVKQRAVLKAARHLRTARRWVDSGRFYEPPVYPPALVGGVADDPFVGHIVADTVIRTSEPDVTRLGQLARRGVMLLGLDAPDASPSSSRLETGLGKAMRAAVNALPRHLPLVAVEVSDAEPTPCDDSRHIKAQDASGALASQWNVVGNAAEARVLVVRPDAYVAACVQADPVGIANAVASVFALRLEATT